MVSVSINEIASKKILESSDPTPFEAVILGTLLVVENPKALFDFLKIRVKPQMFSDKHRPTAQLIFEMLETGEPLRNYRIVELAGQKNLGITKDDITHLRYQHAETDFEELCVSFVDKWYEFSLMQSALKLNFDIESGVPLRTARQELDRRDNEIEELKLGAKEVDYSIYGATVDAINDIEKRKNNNSFISGLATGIYQFDKALGGFEGGELYGCGGSAGEGKTTLVFQCIKHMAITDPVDFFSLEMSKKQLAPKGLSLETGISTINMKLGHVTDAEITALKNALIPISELKLSIIDDVYHIDELERMITLRVKKYGIKGVVIDNLTTIRHNMKGSRDDIETAICYRFKQLAKVLDIPIIILVHKNKDNANRLDKRPVTSDLKFAGGGIAFDVVFFPYSPKLDNEGDNTSADNYAEIVITKNRSTGIELAIPLMFANDWNMYCETTTDSNGNIMPILPTQRMFPVSTPTPNNIPQYIEELTDTPKMPKGNTDTDLPF